MAFPPATIRSRCDTDYWHDYYAITLGPRWRSRDEQRAVSLPAVASRLFLPDLRPLF
jgi:hypothetical protein